MSQPRVAYFCMEFGLDERFPIYAGGLGILAGDILKAAKDANLPVVGVGLCWRQGYVAQRMDERGIPYDSFYEHAYEFLEDTGVVVSVRIRRRVVKAKVWRCEAFGNATLYLLDAYLPKNNDPLLTGQLYGWFNEERLAQEMLLGIGGMRALDALGVNVDVYHFNDSHPVIAGLELVRRGMAAGQSFEDAWRSARERIVFTTHTPVVHGNESYKYDILRYMGVDLLSKAQMTAIGGSPFSMTVAGLRLCKKANAVSQLHGVTAREMWKGVTDAAPILAVTNGVHNGTWQDGRIAAADDASLWEAHMACKKEMIGEIQKRTGKRLGENVLTIGFARRAAPYKRSDLLFRRKKDIEALLKTGKLQLVFSGKAHPNDMAGKQILSTLHAAAQKYPCVVFLEDYAMDLGKLLTRGADVWLNHPRRPMEASGTSGMKAAMNGVVNLSVLDGWWPEGCEHGVNGWQIGGGEEGAGADKTDLTSLLTLLWSEVIPAYDSREKWVAMMRASIEMSSWRFSAARMLSEYYEKMYR